MKKKALKALPKTELEKKLVEAQAEFDAEQAMRKTGGKPSSTGRLKSLRKLRARIKTFLKQLEQKEVKAGTPKKDF